MSDRLIRLGTDATLRSVPNSFEGIRDALDGATMTFASTDRIGAYVDDEGIWNRLPLNVVASLLLARPIFGPAVLCRAEPDDRGNSVTLPDELIRVVVGTAQGWQVVLDNAAAVGQDLTVVAQPDTLPPPRFIPLPDDWLPGDPIPDPEKGT